MISDLLDVIKNKDQIINLLKSRRKTLQDQFNVNERNARRFISSIGHKDYKEKMQIERLNCDFKNSFSCRYIYT